MTPEDRQRTVEGEEINDDARQRRERAKRRENVLNSLLFFGSIVLCEWIPGWAGIGAALAVFLVGTAIVGRITKV